MYFCINCITGKEEKTRIIVELFLTSCIDNQFSVWFPLKETTEKKGNERRVVYHPVFPSYIFIWYNGEKEQDFPFREINKLPNVIKFLKYSNGSHKLIGKDQEYAMWIHRNDGTIRQSTVEYTPGEKVHIVQGSLKGMDANVVKVDKHHKRITLRFNLDGTTTDISFTADFIEKNRDIQIFSQQDSCCCKP